MEAGLPDNCLTPLSDVVNALLRFGCSTGRNAARLGGPMSTIVKGRCGN
jgi:hypothetical protein